MQDIDNYQLEENDSPDMDNRPLSDSGGGNGDDGNTERQNNTFMLLFNLLLTPAEGWKKLRRCKLKPDRFAAATLYPVSALASLAQFVGLLYTPDDGHSSVTQLLVKALITFISFFFGNFLSLALCRLLLPKSARSFPDSAFGKNFVVAMLSTLAIFYVLITLLPMLETILIFLPLWTIYLISQGTKYVKADDDKRATVTGMLCIIILGSPILIAWLFSEILPPL